MPNSPVLKNLRNDLRSNPRLRWLVAMIVGVCGLYGLLLLRDALQVEQQQQRAVMQSINRLRSQLGQPEWLERLPQAKSLAVQLEGRLWQAPTAGLAQSTFQDWLTSALAQSKAVKPLVTVTAIDDGAAIGAEAGSNPSSQAALPNLADSTAPVPPDLWKIKAKLTFAYNASSLLDFLNRIETLDKQIVVDSLIVRKEPALTVDIELLAYFQKPADADKSSSPNPTAAKSVLSP